MDPEHRPIGAYWCGALFAVAQFFAVVQAAERSFNDANWVSMGGTGGPDGPVYATALDALGNLYIGGRFTSVGGTTATNIARWDGTKWSALGPGLGPWTSQYGPFVTTLAVSGNTLYAGGTFTNAGATPVNHIAQWDGTNWSSLGSGIGGIYEAVLALTVSGGTLYAGGTFTSAGGIPANYIAQWNGSGWSALGAGMGGLYPWWLGVHALAVSGSKLYAGGTFVTAGGVSATNIAEWDGTNWSALGLGLGPGGLPDIGPVALAVSGSTLYAGGNFTTAGSIAATNIAQWDGTNWSTLGSGVSLTNLSATVIALAASRNILYVGGSFTSASNLAATNIAQWDGTNWSAVGTGTAGNYFYEEGVYALAVWENTVYAGGEFNLPQGGDPLTHLARWNGSNWAVPGVGLNNYVAALAVSNGTLYVGGAFTNAGGTAVNYVAQWNGIGFSPLGSGMNGNVGSLRILGSRLFAGGAFGSAGGIPASCIAQWDGSNWSALGKGMNGGVTALAVLGSTLYAGGAFTTADGIPAHYLAQWDGSNWSAVGSGMNNYVAALAVSSNTLYAGGYFGYAGTNAANHIAQWNGNTWSPLGSGLNGNVYALAVLGSTLYAGGSFTTAGGTPAYHIAQWNGSSWSPLGSGLNSSVLALALSGGTLYAGGQFTAASGTPASYIARWDGNSWTALGSGVNGSVDALAVSQTTLYAGGYFSIAGGKVSAYCAEASIPASIGIISSGAAFGFTNGAFGFDLSGSPGSSVVIEASPDLQTWIPLQTNSFGSGVLYFSDPQSSTNPRRFYRALLLP